MAISRRARFAALAVWLSFTTGAASQPNFVPLSEMLSGDGAISGIFVRCGALYAATVAEFGDDMTGEQYDLLIDATAMLMATAAVAYQEENDVAPDVADDKVAEQVAEIASIYEQRLQVVLAMTDESFEGDPLVESDGLVCSDILAMLAEVGR